VVLVVVLAFGTMACGADRITDERATGIFRSCLERDGVEVEDLRVTVDADGTVRGITASIVGGADYVPAIRLACTAEVEAA